MPLAWPDGVPDLPNPLGWVADRVDDFATPAWDAAAADELLRVVAHARMRLDELRGALEAAEREANRDFRGPEHDRFEDELGRIRATLDEAARGLVELPGVVDDAAAAQRQRAALVDGALAPLRLGIFLA